jgi:hypothetical protein
MMSNPEALTIFSGGAASRIPAALSPGAVRYQERAKGLYLGEGAVNGM